MSSNTMTLESEKRFLISNPNDRLPLALKLLSFSRYHSDNNDAATTCR